MKNTLIFTVIFFLMSASVLHAEEISLTLDEAITLALRSNRDILLKAEDLKKAKLKIAEAYASLFPALNFTSTWQDTRGYYSKDISSFTTQATLKQYLYKGGKTINTIGYNEYIAAVTSAILDKTKLETILNVKTAFYTLLLAEEFNLLNKDILDNTEAHLGLWEARYQNGEASESEVLRIKGSYENVREAYEASLNQAEALKSLLNNLLYLDKDARIIPQGELICDRREVAYDEGFLKAIKMRPEIRQYAAQEKANIKAIEVTKAEARPSIYASWDYYSRSTTSLTFSPGKGWQDYNIIGVTFSWPIFDGWVTRAKVEEALVDLKEAKLLREKTVKDIALELKNAYLDLRDAISKLKAKAAEVVLYQDTIRVIQEKYNAGIASSLDLKDAALALKVANFNQKQATYDYILAEAKFSKATGG